MRNKDCALPDHVRMNFLGGFRGKQDEKKTVNASGVLNRVVISSPI